MTANSVLSKQNLKKALEALGIRKGSVVYVTGNLGKLGITEGERGEKIKKKEQILELYYKAFIETIGEEGTLVFPTHSWGMVQSEEVFNANKTQCDYLFSEYLRKLPESKRQIHPFSSIGAIGKMKDFIISDKLTRHAYSSQSPFAVMRNMECRHISIGLEIKNAFSAAHYCEFVAGVPYRYTKSFDKKIEGNGGKVSEEEFFLYVCYREAGIIRDRNTKAINSGILQPIKIELGKGFIEGIRLDKTINDYIAAMEEDPYIWVKGFELNREKRPWFK